MRRQASGWKRAMGGTGWRMMGKDLVDRSLREDIGILGGGRVERWLE